MPIYYDLIFFIFFYRLFSVKIDAAEFQTQSKRICVKCHEILNIHLFQFFESVVIYIYYFFFFVGKEMTTTGTVAIAVLSTLLVIAILINIFMGRKLISNRSSKRNTDTPMSQKQDSSQTYTDLTVTDETHAYSTLGSDVREAPYQVISDASHEIK